MAKLTEARIRALKRANRDRWLGDGQNLWLRIRASGRKVFVIRTRQGGHARILTLGEWPTCSLAAARARAAGEARARARRRAAARATPPTPSTVAALGTEFYAARIEPKYRSTKTLQAYRDRLIAALGTKKLRAVTPEDCAAIVNDYARRAPVAARRFRTFLKQCFHYAVARGYLERSPAAAPDRSIARGRAPSRGRVLTEAEMLKLWHAQSPHTALLRFLLLTLADVGDAQRATWQQVKLTRWEIPPRGARDRPPHWVHLSPQALQILWSLPRSRDLVFEHASPTAVEAWMKRFCARERISPAFTADDLRRTASARMAGLGVARQVIACCLHRTRTATPATEACLPGEPERVAALNRWGEELERLVSESVPVPRSVSA